MRRTLRLLTFASLAVLLSACASTDRPSPAIVPVGAQHTTTLEIRYVPIRPELTAPCEVASGPLREIISVARQRRACIEQLNARMAEIAAIQGTPVQPPVERRD